MFLDPRKTVSLKIGVMWDSRRANFTDKLEVLFPSRRQSDLAVQKTNARNRRENPTKRMFPGKPFDHVGGAEKRGSRLNVVLDQVHLTGTLQGLARFDQTSRNIPVVDLRLSRPFVVPTIGKE